MALATTCTVLGLSSSGFKTSVMRFLVALATQALICFLDSFGFTLHKKKAKRFQI
jgi:hypothetical protein